VCKNQVMTLSIKKRINTELFIIRTAALYIGETQIRVGTKEGGPSVALADWGSKYTLHNNAILK